MHFQTKFSDIQLSERISFQLSVNLCNTISVILQVIRKQSSECIGPKTFVLSLTTGIIPTPLTAHFCHSLKTL